MKIKFCWRLISENFIILKTSLGSCEVPQQKLGQIGLDVLTILLDTTDSQTDRQTDRHRQTRRTERKHIDYRQQAYYPTYSSSPPVYFPLQL